MCPINLINTIPKNTFFSKKGIKTVFLAKRMFIKKYNDKSSWKIGKKLSKVSYTNIAANAFSV